ncbi:MAG: alkaline phosphatase family protein, partial [Myxococcales bacterium]
AHEHATFSTIMDMARGIPAIYTVLANYDEIAHRRGPDSAVALESLRGIDDAISRIFAAAAAMPELNYDVYIASDHGQVATRPFEQVMGVTLRDYLALAEPQAEGPPHVPEQAAKHMRRIEALERATQSLPEPVRCACQPMLLDAAKEALPQHAGRLKLLEEVVCIEAGDVAHVYLGRDGHPLPLEAIEKRYPRILRVLRDCPAIGLVAVRGGKRGFAFYRGRRYDLADPEQVRALDLGYGGTLVAEFLAQMLTIRPAGDLVCYGNGLPDGSHVAFCWEFGSHAGVGRDEVENFVIHPRSADFDFTSVMHGADLNAFFTSHYLQRARTQAQVPQQAPLPPPERMAAAWDG